MTNKQTATLMGDPAYRHLAYADVTEEAQSKDDPEIRKRVQDELLYPPNEQRRSLPAPRPVAPLDPDAQARDMWERGFSIGDIATLQGRTLGEVYAAIRPETA